MSDRIRVPAAFLAPLLALGLAGSGCASTPGAGPAEGILDARRERTVGFAEMVDDLAGVRMVYVGESHTNPEHHAVQLRIIEALADRRPRLLIGMEMFPRPFQPVLDRWSAGELDEDAFLREVDWYGQWSDWDLYAPILRFARDRGLRVVALNCMRDFVREIGRVGLDGLSPWRRARLPGDIDTSVARHEKAIRDIFFSHPGMTMSEERFRRFYEAQCTWDETMAESAVRALEASPRGDAAIVVLAGGMHVKDFHPIPERARRRNGLDYRTVLPLERDGIPEGGIPVGPGRPADYVVFTGPTPPPSPVRLGVALRGGDARVKMVAPGSAAGRAGLREGDDLLSLDDRPIRDLVDLRLALETARIGDRVRLAWRREGTEMAGEAVLESPPPPGPPPSPPKEGQTGEHGKPAEDRPRK